MQPPAEVRVERRGNIAIWTLARPDRMNALSRTVVRTLCQLARAAREERTLRSVIITGEGERAFCAGADLKERQSMSIEDVHDFLSLYRVAFGEIDRLNLPVFAAINGVAFGGGLELALACDFRILAPTAQIGLTETSLGIIPGAGGTQRLTKIVGPARAKELILFAKRLDAKAALAFGLVHEVAEAGKSALERALELAMHFENAAPIATAAALEAIDSAVDSSLEAGLTLERVAYERTLRSNDRLEALAAFNEKRKPIFTGT